MDVKTRAAAYGIAGLVLSGFAILAGSWLGTFSVPIGGFDPASPGSLSIMLTDPPSVPAGVTAVYVTYSSIGVHAVGLGDSGWIWTGEDGTIETMGLVNFSQTISVGDVPSGSYNLVAFLVSSAEVTYDGANVSATVNSGRLNIPIPGGLLVNSTTPSAALIDISPVVLNLGTQADPNFVITTTAHALQLPRSEFAQNMRHLGFRMALANHGWYRAFIASHANGPTTNSVTLGPSSFSLSITGPSSESSTVRVIILSPSNVSHHGPLGALADSFVFAVQPDGSLGLVSFASVTPRTMGQIRSAMQTPGYGLPAGATATFTYSGTITTLLSGETVVGGSTFYVRVLGPSTFSVDSVTAT